MDSNNILSISAIVVSVGGAIITAINHTRIRSACCGRRLDVSLDIEKTTPPSSVKASEALPTVVV
jgi:hypothetical protein